MTVARPKVEGGDGKRLTLLGAVKNTTVKVRRLTDPDEEVATYPHLVFRELVAFVLFVAILMAVSVFFNAPLEDKANPGITPNPAKAPWYFVGLQELLHYFHPLLAGIILPGILITFLMALPYIDKNPSRRFRDRRLAILLWILGSAVALVLVIIGQYFRGPGWNWVWPW